MYKKYSITVCFPKEIRVIRIIRLKFVLEVSFQLLIRIPYCVVSNQEIHLFIHHSSFLNDLFQQFINSVWQRKINNPFIRRHGDNIVIVGRKIYV